MDLLQLLAENKNSVVTKEKISTAIWNEAYSPSVSDNKIYVNINRLKSLIESKEHGSKYIFRGKNGYLLKGSVEIVTLG